MTPIDPNSLQSMQNLAANAGRPIHFEVALPLIMHALGMGIFLMICSMTAQLLLSGPATPERPAETPAELVQSSAHVLFMCIAICCLIIVVDNNLARAFTLGAAIALIRFKTKLGEKTSSTALLFGILCGMSAGIAMSDIGWLLAILYGIVQFALVTGVALFERHQARRLRASVLPFPDAKEVVKNTDLWVVSAPTPTQ